MTGKQIELVLGLINSVERCALYPTDIRQEAERREFEEALMKSAAPMRPHPSLACLIIGHRWFLTNKTFRPKVRAGDPHGVREYDLTHHRQTHCQRCGTPNPSAP